MIGNRVYAVLCNPDETVQGELRKHNTEGIWIYGGWAEKVALRFYPIHRIVQIDDAGPVYR